METLFKRAMPWLGEEICIKDAQSQNTVMPGLSLAQWMSMQQNPLLSNSGIQPDYLRSLASPIIQNLGSTDISRQLGLQAQLLQQNNMQFNAPRLPQQAQPVDTHQKIQTPLNQLNSVSQPQQQMQFINQTVSLNQTHSPQQQQPSLLQNNHTQPQILVQNQIPQQQSLMQNQHLMQGNLVNNHTQQHQQLLLQQQIQQQNQQQQPSNQQQQLIQQNRMPVQVPNQTSQLHLSDQIQLQLLQKLQQQQQSLLSQSLLQQSQLPQIQEQQIALLETSQHSAYSNPSSQQQQSSSPQQCGKVSSMNVRVAQSSQLLQQKLQQQQMPIADMPMGVLPAPSTNVISTANLLTAGGTHNTILTDDAPSCSTSPSTNNSAVLPQPVFNRISHQSMVTTEKSLLSPVTVLNPCSLEAISVSTKLAKDVPKLEQNVKPSVPIPKLQGQGVAPPQVYLNNSAQMEYLDSSSSATSACLSQNDGSLQQNLPLPSFNQPSLFRNTLPDGDVPGTDLRNNTLFGVNIDVPLGLPLTNDPLLANSIDSGKYQNQLTGNNAIANYNTSKDAQQEMSSSMVSQSFGVADMAFTSIDSSLTESSLLNRNSWGPATTQFQRLRTYTKVCCPY